LLEHAAINFTSRQQKVDIASAELYFSLLGCQVEKVTGFIEILSFHSSPGSVVQQCVVQTDTREIKKFGRIFVRTENSIALSSAFLLLDFCFIVHVNCRNRAKLSPQAQAAWQISRFSVRKTNLPIK
jgi:hypothetical protein